MGFSKIVFDVFDFDFKGCRIDIIFFDKRIMLGKFRIERFERPFVARKLVVAGGDFFFQLLERFGQLPPLAVNRRNFSFNFEELFFYLVKAFLLRVQLVFKIAERVLLYRQFFPQKRRLLLGSIGFRLHLGFMDTEVFQRFPVLVYFYCELLVFGMQIGYLFSFFFYSISICFDRRIDTALLSDNTFRR